MSSGSVVSLPLGELLNRFASAVAAALVGTGCADASSSLVSVEAIAFAGLSVTEALVGAFHVEVAFVGVGIWVLLGGAPRINLRSGKDSG
jgi:hypothetical protein